MREKKRGKWEITHECVIGVEFVPYYNREKEGEVGEKM